MPNLTQWIFVVSIEFANIGNWPNSLLFTRCKARFSHTADEPTVPPRILLGRMRTCSSKHWDDQCCQPLLFSYRNSIPDSTGSHVAGASVAYENQALREFKKVLNYGFRNPGAEFQILWLWNLDSRFQLLVGFTIPWAVFRIPKTRISDFTVKICWILESWFP